jgi:hypothetical protein
MRDAAAKEAHRDIDSPELRDCSINQTLGRFDLP